MPVIRVRCHPSREAWVRALLADQDDLQVVTDDALYPDVVLVRPPSYDITATIGFETD